MESNRTITELIDFIRRTKGAPAAKMFYSNNIKPFLISIEEAYDSDMLKKLDEETCCINPNCPDRHAADLTFHHLFPKTYRHDWFRKKQIPNRQDGVLICRKCHSIFHRAKTNAEIFKSYTTPEAIVRFFIVEHTESSSVSGDILTHPVSVNSAQPKYKKGDVLEVNVRYSLNPNKARHNVSPGTVVELIGDAQPYQTWWNNFAFVQFKGAPCYYCKTPTGEEVLLLEAELTIPN